jgi:DNA-binding transcriptional MerR regulator
MAQDVNGLKIYTIGEALQCADVSRATYFRWVKLGRIRDTRYKDRNGRRVFTQSEVDILVSFAKKLIKSPQLGFSLDIDLEKESS